MIDVCNHDRECRCKYDVCVCILCKDVIYRFDFIDLANGNSGMNFNKIRNFNSLLSSLNLLIFL